MRRIVSTPSSGAIGSGSTMKIGDTVEWDRSPGCGVGSGVFVRTEGGRVYIKISEVTLAQRIRGFTGEVWFSASELERLRVTKG